MKFFSVSLVLAFCCHPLLAAEMNLAKAAARGIIAIEDLTEHAELLAGDLLEGREAGQSGGHAAAVHIMRTLRAARLKPAGDAGSFLQVFGADYRNVLAIIPGSDPQLKDQFILLSAHFDHVGYGTRKNSQGPVGAIHNGADDNASGVSAVLELCEALQAHQHKLGCSVLVTFWDAEEKGLLGSKHWLRNPTVEVQQIRMMVNVDMIGRLRDSLSLFGTRTLPGLRGAWSKANLESELRLDFPWVVLNNSDHHPFFRQQIPITMVHTGLHDDYHTPRDDVERLNMEGIRRTTELLFNFIVQMTNRKEWGEFRQASLTEGTAAQRYFERIDPKHGQRLGITMAADEGDHVVIARVAPSSPADQAGLQVGDTIVGIDAKPLQGRADLRRAVGSTFGKLALEVKRGGQYLELPVRLGGSRPRVGFGWRTDPAEPNVAVLSHVVPKSAADRAGLLRLDRIHALDGAAPFADGLAFRTQLDGARGAVELLVERQGQMVTVPMQMPVPAEDSSPVSGKQE